MTPESGEITWVAFTAYMDSFKSDLAATFANREACKVRHEEVTERMKNGDARFREIDRRLRVLELRVYGALAVFGAFQWLVQNNLLRIGGQ